MKTNFNKWSVWIFFLFLTQTINAQQNLIRGSVISKSDGEPIIGASILHKESSTGTITDFNGEFQLNVETGSSLVVSYIGFKNQTVKASPSMRIVLEED
ncbi:MAG: carboxypeptidase-like regulatory domain-containing protein, partial [Phocaeicola sp.]